MLKKYVVAVNGSLKCILFKEKKNYIASENLFKNNNNNNFSIS